MGSIIAIGGPNYVEHTASSFGFNFKNASNVPYMLLKSDAKALTDGTSKVVFVDNV
jgi:hypothetical protein